LPSGLLRYDLHAMCAAAPHGAARQSPDEHLHSASRWGGWIKFKIKIKSPSNGKIKRSHLRQLLPMYSHT
jgi:hypothetical protein